MRTTIELPDSMLRRLKAQAALEGTTLKSLVLSVVERGLRAPAEAVPKSPRKRVSLPSMRLGRPLNLPHPSNAALAGLLDE